MPPRDALPRRFLCGFPPLFAGSGSSVDHSTKWQCPWHLLAASSPSPLPPPQVFEYSKANVLEEVFYPTYDLSNFSWDSVNRTLNHTALTAEFVGGPATDPSGSFSNGSLAFRVSTQGDVVG